MRTTNLAVSIAGIAPEITNPSVRRFSEIAENGQTVVRVLLYSVVVPNRSPFATVGDRVAAHTVNASSLVPNGITTDYLQAFVFRVQTTVNVIC